MLTQVSLPYDVLSKTQIEEYLKSPNHIMHLEAGKRAGEALPNPYTHAKENLERMLSENFFTQLGEACYVVTQERFMLGGVQKTINRIWGLVPNQDYIDGQVMRHENTRENDLKDRVDLLNELEGFKTKPTWLAVRDKRGSLEKFMENAIEVAGEYLGETNGRELTVAYITTQVDIDMLKKILQNEKSLILDGHHGFAASKEYGQDKDGGHKFMLCAISSEHNPGYAILPTYRILGKKFRKLTKEFEMTDIQIMDKNNIQSELADLPYHFAVIQDDKIKVFKLKDKYKPDGNPLEQLDVYQLHSRLLEPSGFKNGELDYDADLSQAIEKGKYVIYVRPPTQKQVWALTESGKTTPPKSTLYVPKLLSGLFNYNPN